MVAKEWAFPDAGKRHIEEERAKMTDIRRQNLNSYDNHAWNAYDAHSQHPSKLSHTSAKKLHFIKRLRFFVKRK